MHDTKDQRPSFIGLADAAYDVGISKKTLQNWLIAGKFPVETVKIGDRRLIPTDAWESWKASLRAASSDPIDPTTTAIVKRGRGRPRRTGGAQ